MKKLKSKILPGDIGIYLTNGREERDRFSTIVIRKKFSKDFRKWFGIEV